jgi:hypothetical protein
VFGGQSNPQSLAEFFADAEYCRLVSPVINIHQWSNPFDQWSNPQSLTEFYANTEFCRQANLPMEEVGAGAA